VLTPEDRKRKWVDDEEASSIFTYAKKKADGHTLLPCYAVSDAAAETIADIAATVGASQLILGAPQRSMVVNLLRGNIIRNISSILPDEIDLLVYA
jgi:K+-sensing histidine kinase KdpD